MEGRHASKFESERKATGQDRVPAGQEFPLLATSSERAAGLDALEELENGIETAIVLQVSAALLADPPMQLTVIEVSSEEGVVTLTGEVGSSQVHYMAGKIASDYPGVTSAINELVIRQRALDGHVEQVTIGC